MLIKCLRSQGFYTDGWAVTGNKQKTIVIRPNTYFVIQYEYDLTLSVFKNGKGFNQEIARVSSSTQEIRTV